MYPAKTVLQDRARKMSKNLALILYIMGAGRLPPAYVTAMHAHTSSRVAMDPFCKSNLATSA